MSAQTDLRATVTRCLRGCVTDHLAEDHGISICAARVAERMPTGDHHDLYVLAVKITEGGEDAGRFVTLGINDGTECADCGPAAMTKDGSCGPAAMTKDGSCGPQPVELSPDRARMVAAALNLAADRAEQLDARGGEQR